MNEELTEKIASFKERYGMRASLGTHFRVAVVCRNTLEKMQMEPDISSFNDNDFTFLPIAIGDDIYGIKAHTVIYTNWAKDRVDYIEGMNLNGFMTNWDKQWNKGLISQIRKSRGDKRNGILS